jgi:hypothetical protein
VPWSSKESVSIYMATVWAIWPQTQGMPKQADLRLSGLSVHGVLQCRRRPP